MRKTEYQYVNRVIEEGMKGNNTRPFWRYVKPRRQENTRVAPLKKSTTLFSDSTAKAKILLDQFRSVFTKDVGSQLPMMESTPYPVLTDLVIKTEGVAKLLRNLNPAKACGPDNIPSRILKECADTIAPAVSCIFSRSVQTGQLPSDWLTANISSVFKKGDRSKAENYRPISLTSVACKLLEHIICRTFETTWKSTTYSVIETTASDRDTPLRPSCLPLCLTSSDPTTLESRLMW